MDRSTINQELTENQEDYNAEMRRDQQAMTADEWTDFIEEQEAASWVAAERHAERALSFGYAG